ncbi:MAG TPA: alpha/beta fold hydrolase, partial [Acidimicrobiales bacterium]|nr:alpha/beta fold hydrolase [Acidimicrobiales bacterium]
EPPYLLADMADDAVAVLDDLGVAAAHVVGASMGGMIAQAIAVGHPDRVRTLTSIMSTTGAPGVGAPHPDVLPLLTRPAPADAAAAVEASVASARVVASPGFPFDEARVRAQAEAAAERAFHPAGVARQLVAIVASPDRTPGLRRLQVPTLVIHGDDDPLVDVSGGRATAEAVPGARLVTIPGMGHDLPPALYDRVADLIADLAAGGPAA